MLAAEFHPPAAITGMAMRSQKRLGRFAYAKKNPCPLGSDPLSAIPVTPDVIRGPASCEPCLDSGSQE